MKIGDSISWTSLSICGRGMAEVVAAVAEVVAEAVVEVVAVVVAAVAGGHLHKEGHLDLERSKLHYELRGVLVGFREEADREERDRVVRPRRV